MPIHYSQEDLPHRGHPAPAEAPAEPRHGCRPASAVRDCGRQQRLRQAAQCGQRRVSAEMPRRGCKKTWRRLRALEAEVAEQQQREARQAEALEAEITRREQQQQQHVGHLELEVTTLRDQLPRPVPPQPEPEPDDIDMILEDARECTSCPGLVISSSAIPLPGTRSCKSQPQTRC